MRTYNFLLVDESSPFLPKMGGVVVQFSSVQFIDSMQQLHHGRMIAQIRTWWKRT